MGIEICYTCSLKDKWKHHIKYKKLQVKALNATIYQYKFEDYHKRRFIFNKFRKSQELGKCFLGDSIVPLCFVNNLLKKAYKINDKCKFCIVNFAISNRIVKGKKGENRPCLDSREWKPYYTSKYISTHNIDKQTIKDFRTVRDWVYHLLYNKPFVAENPLFLGINF